MNAVARRLYGTAWVAGLAALSPALVGAALVDRGQVRRRVWPRRSRASERWWWWHGASAGEVRGLATLHSAVRWEDTRCFTVVSSTTGSGLQTWESVGIGDEKPHVLPADLRFCWERLMPDTAPRLLVVSETELWPTWLSWLAARDVPVALVSARLSRRTRGYLSRLHLLDGVHDNLYVAAQTERDAEEFLSLGVPARQVVTTGSLKWPRRPPVDPATVRARLGVESGDRIVVGGSMRRGELARFVSVLGALKGSGCRFRAILAPRRTADCAHAERLLGRSGLGFERWSWLLRAGRCWRSQVLLVDTLGDLAWLYGAGTAAVIGGSWEPVGGHNPFEAAVYGMPIAYGPHMKQPGCELLERNGQAVRVNDWRALPTVLAEWLRSTPVVTCAPYPDAVGGTLSAWERWGIVPEGLRAL